MTAFPSVNTRPVASSRLAGGSLLAIPEAQSHIDEETIQSTTVEITEEQARHMERAIVQDQIRVPNQTGMSGLLTASCSKGVQRYDADILDNHVGAIITLDVEASNTIDNVKMHSRRSSAWEATSCLLHSRSSFANIAGVHGEIKISSNEIDGNIPSLMSRQSQRQLSVIIDMGQGAQPSPPRCLRTRPASYLEWPLRSRSTRVWQSWSSWLPTRCTTHSLYPSGFSVISSARGRRSRTMRMASMSSPARRTRLGFTDSL